jgi:hypothetical protein
LLPHCFFKYLFNQVIINCSSDLSTTDNEVMFVLRLPTNTLQVYVYVCMQVYLCMYIFIYVVTIVFNPNNYYKLRMYQIYRYFDIVHRVDP